MRYCFVVSFLFITFISRAQTSVRGVVQDSTASPLPMATVMLLQRTDSVLYQYTSTDANGKFELANVKNGIYRFRISYVSYQTLEKIITVQGQAQLDMGILKLKNQAKQLQGVTVQGELEPVTIKKDTVEYNASSFKVRPNANVEELLKKLPGIDVANDGSIQAMGKDVQKVLVDGREFFGRDPKMATQNLPADAVKKVQVFDKKTDQAAFTGVDDGQRETAINLELKDNAKNGSFGNAQGGIGTNDRFRMKASLNRFSPKKQLSFLGMANNVNEQSFGMQDFSNFTGASQQSLSGGTTVITSGQNNAQGVPVSGGFGGNNVQTSGINTTYAGGVNYNTSLKRQGDLSTSYFYNNIQQHIVSETERVNFLNTGNYFFNQTANQDNTNENHRVNVTASIPLDSVNTLRTTAQLTYSKMTQAITSNSETTSATANTSSGRYTGNTQYNPSLNWTAQFRHKLNRKGRSLSLQGNLIWGNTTSNGQLNSTNLFSKNETQTITQTNNQIIKNRAIGGTFTYTEPLGKRRYIEAIYDVKNNQNNSVRDVFDVLGNASTKNTTLSNDFTSNYFYQRPSLSFRKNVNKYTFVIGVGYQTTQLKGTFPLQNNTINRQFQSVQPFLRYTRNIAMGKSLNIDYAYQMNEPTIQQLQPVVNNTDPLNLSLGNVSIQPGLSHVLSSSLHLFNPTNFSMLFVNLNGNYDTRAISSSQDVNEQLVRTTRPVNVNNNYSISANVTYGFRFSNLDKGIQHRIRFTPSGTYGKSTTLINSESNNAIRLTTGLRGSYNFEINNLWSFEAGARLTRVSATYSLGQTPQQVYFNHTFSGESNLTFLKNYLWSTEMNYYVYLNPSADFQQRIPIWNTYISRFVLKGNAGEIRLGVNNILNKNASVQQTSTSNYQQITSSNNLGRYWMFSFIYKLNPHLNMGDRQNRMRAGRAIMVN